MNFSTVTGLIVAGVVVWFGVLAPAAKPQIFLDSHALILVFGGTLAAGLHSLLVLVRASESSLEFVGNLIGNVHNISLDRLDPTYPRCF